MANNKSCLTPGCKGHVNRRSLLCAACWAKLPETAKEDVRKGTDKGEHTLRAKPSREWIGRALKYTQSKTQKEAAA